MHKDYGLALLCDLHGHSKLYNAFIYGCRSLGAPEDTKIFPYILSKISPYFSFEYCKFGAYRCKETTARVCMFRELQYVPAIYTLEASFCGGADGTVYTPAVLKSIGRDLCRALIPYCNINVALSISPILSPTQSKSVFKDTTKKNVQKNKEKVLGTQWRNELLNELKSNKDLLNVGDVDECSGSDSAPSDDNLPDNIMAKIVPHEVIRKRSSAKKPSSILRRSKKSAFTLKKSHERINERTKVKSVQNFKKSTVTSLIERIKNKPQLAKRHKPFSIMTDSSIQTELQHNMPLKKASPSRNSLIKSFDTQ